MPGSAHSTSSQHRTGGVGAVGRLVSLLAAFVAVSVVAGVLGAGLLMPAVGATGTVAGNSVDFFDSLPEELEQQPLSQQSRILWADGSTMATFYFENRVLVPLSGIAPVMRQAVIAIEDARFYEHGGVDPKGMSRAFVNNFSGGDTQGASTLTQQWVKNVLLEQARASENAELESSLINEDYGRKLREAKLAISAEKNLTKDEILERYLNIALFGDGQYGVQTAATHFFSKSAADLSLPDAALLAGMIQSPRRLDPTDNPEGALQRRDIVLSRMLQLEMIDQAQHDEAVAVPLEAQLAVQEASNGCQQAGTAAYFCDYVTKVLLNDATFGADVAARQRLLYRGGLTITTTLDKNQQQAAWESVIETTPPDNAAGVGTSLVSVEPGTGRITAMAQNRTYTPSPEPVAGGTVYNYNVDRAYGGTDGWQPGSTYKPFTLATWLEAEKGLSQRISAPQRPSYQIGDDFQASCGRLVNDSEGPYRPQNSEGEGGGTMTVLEATFNSVNTAYLEMARELDLCAIRDTAQRLGVHRADGGDLLYSPATVIGTNEVSPLTMASAFATFADSGNYCHPVAITSVTDATGAELPVPASDCQQVMDPEIANGVTYALTQTVEQGTARSLTLDRPAAGKTGTTNDSWETWFVGFTPQLATASWVGTPDDQTSLNDKEIQGTERQVFGATYAAPQWERFMERALEGQPVMQFPEASERALLGPRVTVPSVAGQDAGAAEATIEEADLEAEVSGNRTFSGAPVGTVATTNPGPGSRVPPGTTVTIVISAGPQPAPAPEPEPEPEPPPPTPPGDDGGGDGGDGGGGRPGDGPPGQDPPGDD